MEITFLVMANGVNKYKSFPKSQEVMVNQQWALTEQQSPTDTQC